MKDKQSIFAVLGVLLVVGVFVWLANFLTAPRPLEATDSPTDEPSVTSSESLTPTPTPTPTVLAGCTPVPPAPTAPLTMTTAPDIEAVRGKTYVGTITTNCGPITVELDGAKAPATVSSFVLLAQNNYWANTPCHRLTGEADGLFVLQCGDPTGTGGGPGPGYHFGIENAPADGKYPAGTLAMARTSDPNSNGDQFFIVYKDTTLPTDGGGYTIFGKVTAGLDIVEKVAAAGSYSDDSGDQKPLAPISLLTVSAQPKA